MTDLEDKFYVYRDPAIRDFSASLRSKKIWEAGDVLAPVEVIRTEERDYTTVQCGPSETDHIRIESVLVYVNHSCEPNVAFDMSSGNPDNWNVRALKRIQVGEDVTFFYPSTEWELDQPFECRCGTPSCLKTLRGAKYLSTEELGLRGYVSPWILQLSHKKLPGKTGRIGADA